MINYVNTDKLRKAITFMREKKVGAEFDLNSVVAAGRDQYNKNGDLEWCGTICCFMGWMPACFPEECEWTAVISQPLAIDGVTCSYSALAEHLFGIEDDTASYLFTGASHRIHSTLKLPEALDCEGTSIDEFCDMLITFIKLVEDGKIDGHAKLECSLV